MVRYTSTTTAAVPREKGGGRFARLVLLSLWCRDINEDMSTQIQTLAGVLAHTSVMTFGKKKTKKKNRMCC